MQDLTLTGLAAEIRRRGPVPFSRFQEIALYGPDGFYERGGGAGRRRDFLTSPEVGPLFGAVIARALDRWWDELDRPDPFVVVECGAGPGTLANTVLLAAPRCAPALRYVLVDRSSAMRTAQAAVLPVVPLAEALGQFSSPLDPDRHPVPAQGPVVSLSSGLPTTDLPMVVLANELLDNCPVDVVERTVSGWNEIRVGVSEGAERFCEVQVAASKESSDLVNGLVPPPVVRPGQRLPIATAASTWIGDTLQAMTAGGGRLAVFDYGAPTAELVHRRWLRTYRGHTLGHDPLEEAGARDITVDVPFDQLTTCWRTALDRPQHEFLRAYGIDELVEAGRRQWVTEVASPTVSSLIARSRVREAEALCDPGGLGGFRVLEWTR